MILKSGEEKRRQDETTIEEFECDKNSEESLKGKGTLFLTTQRLILERTLEGKTVTVFEFPLKAVSRVSLKGLLRKAISLEVPIREVSSKEIDFSSKKGLAHLIIKVNDPKGCVSEIAYRSGSSSTSRLGG